MTFPDFDALMDRYYAKMVKMRETKGKEYACHDTDRLANFKEIAVKLGVTPEKVLLIYSEKHSRAIMSYCKDGKTYSEESIKSRITDRILYDFLLLGLIEDEENETRIAREAKRTTERFEEETSRTRNKPIGDKNSSGGLESTPG